MQSQAQAAARKDLSGARARAQPAAAPDEAGRRRRAVRRTALVCALVAAAFYVGFIVMMLVRATTK
jgi:hypothetical protein